MNSRRAFRSRPRPPRCRIGIRNVVRSTNSTENTIDAQLVANAVVGSHVMLLDELEAGLAGSNLRQGSSDKTNVNIARPQRDPARVLNVASCSSPQRANDHRAAD